MLSTQLFQKLLATLDAAGCWGQDYVCSSNLLVFTLAVAIIVYVLSPGLYHTSR